MCKILEIVGNVKSLFCLVASCHVSIGYAQNHPANEKYIAPTMIYVKGGTFIMGCDQKKETECLGGEYPSGPSD
jgi:formylglycine-generating enzyme required for sulfatase activity